MKRTLKSENKWNCEVKSAFRTWDKDNHNAKQRFTHWTKRQLKKLNLQTNAEISLEALEDDTNAEEMSFSDRRTDKWLKGKWGSEEVYYVRGKAFRMSLKDQCNKRTGSK